MPLKKKEPGLPRQLGASQPSWTSLKKRAGEQGCVGINWFWGVVLLPGILL